MMLRKVHRYILFFILILSWAGLHAQFGKNCETRQFKINFVSPGLEYEAGIGVNSTLSLKFAIQPALDPSAVDPYSDIRFLPAVSLQFRLYHNFENRYRKGRFIYGNSGNYIAPAVAMFTSSEEVTRADYGYAGLVYGIQRSFGSGFNFSIDAGAGYHVGSFRGGVYPVVNIGIGWIVSQRRWCVGK